MKIALITIHRTGNYGAVLQAFATKQVLSKFGDVETIDYDNRHLAHHIDLVRFDFSKRGFMMLVHDLLRLPYRARAVSKFVSFLNNYLSLTRKYTAKQLMAGQAGHYDSYVCGSDQIWNPDIVSADCSIDPVFFLSFAPGNNKISYASSMGHYLFNDNERKELSNLLDDFSMISTRESDGVEKLKQVLPDRDIFHVLDPTLLLDKKEWLDAFGIEESKTEEKYILVYSVPRTDLLRNAVEYYSNKLGLKVIAIDQMLKAPANVDQHIRDAGPEDFIKLFANAEFVITDSFHGTCFAINFQKPFVSVSAGKRASRIISLLNLTGLESHLVSSDDDFVNVPLDPLKEVFLESLALERTRSKDYLNKFFVKS